MATSLSQDIKDAVNAAVPAQVARQVCKRLEEVEALEQELETSQGKNEALGREVDRLRALNIFQTELDSRKTELDRREELLDARNKSLDDQDRARQLFELETRLAASQGFNANLTGFMADIAKNTTWRRRFSGDVVAGMRPAEEDEYGSHRPGGPEVAYVDQETEIVAE